MLGEVLVRAVDEGVRLVLRLDQLLAVLIGVGVRLGVANHLLHLSVGETAAALDGDLLLLASRLVARGDIHDAVGVDVEGHLNLGGAAGGRGDAHEVEVTEHLVVRRHLALALQHLDADLGLVVRGGGEGLGLLRGDGGVAVDEAGEDAAEGLDAERERGDVEEENVLDVTAEDTALDGGAHGDNLVGVDTLVGLLPGEELLHNLRHLGHAGHAAHEEHLVDLRSGDAGVLQAAAAGVLRAVEEGTHELLELGARHAHRHVLGPGGVSGDEGKVDVRGHCGGQLNLRLLRSLAQALHRELIPAEVNALLLLKVGGELVEQRGVEILAAKEGVAVRRLHLEHAPGDLQDGHVEGPTAEIVHRHETLFLVHAVAQRRGGGLVDDAEHVEARDLTGILGRLALRVVEVRGNSHHRLGDGMAEVGLRSLLHLLQHEGAHLGGGVLLAASLDPRVAVGCGDDVVRDHLGLLLGVLVVEATADKALARVERVSGVGHRLALGGLTHEALAFVGEGDHGGSGAGALGVLDHLGGLALHHRDT